MSLSKPYRQALALFILAAVLYALFSVCSIFIFSPITENRRDIAELRFQIDRQQRVATNAATYVASLTSLNGEISEHREFLESTDHSVASANLQAAVREFAQQSGAQIITLEGHPSEDHGSLQEVSISVSSHASIDDLRSFLYQIGAHRPYLTVKDLRLSRRAQGRTDGRQDNNQVNAQFRVVGHMRPIGNL
ncbi:MAG: type II secretion system protein GspM [Pseudomonadota bacterium]